MWRLFLFFLLLGASHTTPSRRFLKTHLPSSTTCSIKRTLPNVMTGQTGPSCVPIPLQQAKDNDKKNCCACYCKVRACIQCGECHKARCVYSQCHLNLQELNEISRIKESNIYTCGSILFPPGSKYENSIIVREALTCSTTIETQYYSSKLVSFPPICYPQPFCLDT